MAKLQFPDYLSRLEDLRNHLNAQFQNLSTAEKGRKFAIVAQEICSRTEFGRDFPKPRMRKGSHDEGVDIEAFNVETGGQLLAQVKYTVSSKDDLDGIFSKFQQDSLRASTGQLRLFTSENEDKKLYQLYTLSDITGILNKFRASHLASVDFYKMLFDQNRIEIIQGAKILQLLQNLYRETFLPPKNHILRFIDVPFAVNNVIIGVIEGKELRRMHKQYGDSIFFENIREYIRDSEVNKGIAETLKEKPDTFLARNNGIVVRASQAINQDDPTYVELIDPSIVNGCQTTVSVVHHGRDDDDCRILVKVVVEEQSWAVARAANWQNQIQKIELDIAEFFRPQRVREIATRYGIGIFNDTSAYSVINAVSQQQLVLEDLRALFVGLFSKSPNNVFDQDRSALLVKALADLYVVDPDGESFFENLFLVQHASTKELAVMEKELEDEDKGVMARVFKNSTVTYRAFLIILACCLAAENKGLLDDEGWHSRVNLIEDTSRIIQRDNRNFQFSIAAAYQAIAGAIPTTKNEGEVGPIFYKQVKTQNFAQLYRNGLSLKKNFIKFSKNV